MKEVQFSAVVLLWVLAALLAWQLPNKVREDKVTNRSRWLMVIGLTLLGTQFLLQYIFGFREKSVAQAVMLNLAIFIPCAVLLSLSVLNLQRQGHIHRNEIAVGCYTYLLAIALLVWGQLKPENTLLKYLTEIIASSVYAAMQFFYSWRIRKEQKRIKQMLADYYDLDPENLVHWMQMSIEALSVLALTVPFCIFLSGLPLAIYGLFFFMAITYLWWRFARYVIGSGALKVKEAERSEESSVKCEEFASAEVLQHVDKAVRKWEAKGGFRQHNLKSADVAQELNIPRSNLLTWVKLQGNDSFTKWITKLRIEEAKRILHEHPEYSISYVAEYCGLSRTHFQKIFKEYTGLSPAEFLAQSEGA